MRRCFFVAVILLSVASGAAADDQTLCNDHDAHRVENFAACDRAIASGLFSGSALRDLYFNRARHAGTYRDAEHAYADYVSALRLDPGNTDLLDRAFITAVASGKVDEGSALAARILSIDKSNRIARLVVGVQALKQKNYSAAVTNINQSIRGPITDLVAALLSAWARYGDGDAGAAIAAIDKLAGPQWYPIFKDLHAGLILELSGKEREAGARFERAYNLDNSMLRPTEAYARWLSRNGRVPAARDAYDAFEKKLPRHPLVRDGLRRIDAGEKLPPLINSPQAGAAEALYGIGATMIRKGGEDLALVYLQLALYLQPGHPMALLSLADLYEVVKKPEYAVSVYRRVSTSTPLWRNAQIQLATDLDSIGQTDESYRILRPIAADEPRDLEAIMALGNIERGHKKFAECVGTYSLGIDVLPPSNDKANSVWYYYRGICEGRSKQWSKAEADMRKALQLQPDQPHVLNYLGYSLVDQGQKIDEALGMIRRAVQQRPDDGYIIDSLGWAYYKVGDLTQAEKNLKRAVELKPDDPTIRQHMGDAFWRLGRKPEARAEWTEAIRLKPEPQDLAEIESRLRDGLSDGSTPKLASSSANTEPVQSTAAVPALAPVRADKPTPTAKRSFHPAGALRSLLVTRPTDRRRR